MESKINELETKLSSLSIRLLEPETLELRYKPIDKELYFLESAEVCYAVRRWALKNNFDGEQTLVKIQNMIIHWENKR